jgi:hypothetical protein
MLMRQHDCETYMMTSNEVIIPSRHRSCMLQKHQLHILDGTHVESSDFIVKNQFVRRLPIWLNDVRCVFYYPAVWRVSLLILDTNSCTPALASLWPYFCNCIGLRVSIFWAGGNYGCRTLLTKTKIRIHCWLLSCVWRTLWFTCDV